MYKGTWSVRLMTLPTQTWWEGRINKEDDMTLKWNIKYNRRYNQPSPSYLHDPFLAHSSTCDYAQTPAEAWTCARDYCPRSGDVNSLFKPSPAPLLLPVQPKTRAFLYRGALTGKTHCVSRFPEAEREDLYPTLKNYENGWKYGLPTFKCPTTCVPGKPRIPFYRKTEPGSEICPYILWPDKVTVIDLTVQGGSMTCVNPHGHVTECLQLQTAANLASVSIEDLGGLLDQADLVNAAIFWMDARRLDRILRQSGFCNRVTQYQTVDYAY
ncbi:hypothetical protein LAZ67_2005194 [Cordylochernes scorpioides]|uniref:Uncharacterized protein n=1 Tax=Cordylochernes scorpioides TaxID=51811 RepID=A0ABY6K552_9ARAC|nr:hypothetical protein LAZ67_2005194 [Cordylochernes scorpioides]